MLKTRIKAGQITNLTDARYFAAWGIDWMGFNLEAGSEGYLAPQAVVGIKSWVEGPKIIGEFEFQSAAHMQETAEQLELDGIQVGAFCPVEEIKQLKDLIIIQKYVVNEESTAEALAAFMTERSEVADLFLLDFSANKYDWEKIDIGRPERISWDASRTS